MPPDKYSAVWTSHTSISDFLKCPRAYFLKHVYKDPKTNHKVKVMSPALALGQAVHDTLESLSVLSKDERFDTPLMDRFEESWKKISGKRGGFLDELTENQYKNRGREMIVRAYNHPGPLKRLAVKIQQDLPYFWLSEEENIILCGKIDWLEYLPETDSVHIIDFKTGKVNEDKDSLQLPIYHLLVHNCQKRKVDKASYWYIGRDDTLTEKELPDLEEAHQKVLAIARKMKLARQLKKFTCLKRDEGCFACRPMEAVVAGDGELIYVDDFNYDVYILPNLDSDLDRESVIL